MATDRSSQPFYFTVVFWGETHRRYFVDFLVAALLAPSNLPALDRRRRSKFLIACPDDDWAALEGEPNMRQLAGLLEIVHMPLAPPLIDEGKMMTMSRGHKIVSERCFAERAYGVYLTPDLILSDGSVAAMQRLAEAGKSVVLAVAIRFSQDPMIEQLAREGFYRRGAPMAIPPRDLVRIGLAHLHTETLRYEFEARWFADMPISIYWKVPGGDGIIIHSFSWAPLLVDYAAIERHDTSTFDEWTLDGDYVHKNFGSSEAIHVVRDSDEIMLVSFTRESEFSYDLKADSDIVKALPHFGEHYKLALIRRLYTSHIMDPLKRDIFQEATFLHWKDMSQQWHKKERQIQAMLHKEVWNFPHSVSAPMDWTIWLVLRGWTWLVLRGRRRWKQFAFVWTWHYRHRRFLWWRLKNKLGLVGGTTDSNDPKWLEPIPGVANPIFTLGWLWHRLRSKKEAQTRDATTDP